MVSGSVAAEARAAIPHRNVAIQWLRGAAALMVLLYHASHYLNVERGDPRMLAIFGGSFGVLGVAVFFAISGALMADVLGRTAPATFLMHRIARIYPTFLIASLLLPPLLLGRFTFDARSLSLVPLGPNGSYRLNLEWTLIFETFYYVLLFLLARAGGARRIASFAAAWLVVVVAAAFILPPQILNALLPTILLILFNPANAAFAGGLLIPFLVRRGAFHPIAAVAVGALALLVGPLIEQGGMPAARLLASVAAVAIVGLAASAPEPPFARGLLGRAATRLGDWSYGLYLCHPTIVVLVYRHVDAAPLSAWALAFAASLAVSAPLGMLDTRLYRRLRPRVDAMDAKRRRTLVWAYLAFYGVFAAVFAVKEIVDPSG